MFYFRIIKTFLNFYLFVFHIYAAKRERHRCLGLGTQFKSPGGWQGRECASLHLLCARACSSWELQSRLGQDSPGHSDTGCTPPKQGLNQCVHVSTFLVKTQSYLFKRQKRALIFGVTAHITTVVRAGRAAVQVSYMPESPSPHCCLLGSKLESAQAFEVGCRHPHC